MTAFRAGAGGWWMGLLVLLLALTGCEPSEPRTPASPDLRFRPDGYLDFLRPDGTIITRIAIEIAESDSAQMRGLMQRTTLPARGGMLFINPDARPRTFWMKNTPLSLDILFVAPDSGIVNIARNTRPYSEETIPSTGPAQFVVEVRAGFTQQHGIDDSARIRWKRAVIPVGTQR